METKQYPAVVVGAGPGGYVCAIRLAQLGVKTLCIERAYWGGVCLNVGCIPSKTMITAGKRVEEIQKAAEMGIVVSGEPTVDMAKLQAWKGKVVDKLTGGIRKLLQANGVERMQGEAHFVGPRTLEVTTEDGKVRIEAEHLVLATGSRPIEIPGFSYDDPRILDSTKALALKEIPKRLVVIGGGYIGLELGQMMAKVGAEVHVVEMTDTVLTGFDPEVCKFMLRKLKKSGIKVHLNSKAESWEEGDDGAVVHITTPDGPAALDADAILVTVGRRPNSEGFEATGVALDRGHVVIDNQQKTNVAGVYAIGDVAGGIQLAHKASHEGEIAAEVIAGHNAANDARTVPAVVFTDPEIATAGLMEHEAREEGLEIKVGKIPYAAIGRALTTGETEGFFKVITNAEDGEILGVTIMGSHASDLISEAVLAVEMYAEAMDLSLSIHPHPTLGEGVMEAAKAAMGQAIHAINKK